MARILLVNPPFYRLWGSHYNGMMMGISSLCAVLRAEGHECYMLNADFEPHDRYLTTRSIYENASGLVPWEPQINSLVEETIQAILSFSPDWVGYTCFSANYGIVKAIIQQVSQRDLSILQVIGGPHVTVDSIAGKRISQYLYQLTNEAEISLPHLVDSGHTIKSTRIQDLDSLPNIDRTHWWSLEGREFSELERQYLNTSYLATARGCPYGCHFCSAPRLWDRRVTYRSTDLVLVEMQSLLNNEEDNTLHIVDDAFTANRKRALQILSGLYGNKKPWKCESRADAITEPLVQALANAGCSRVKIGFESGSNNMLAALGKNETLDTMHQAVAFLKQANIPVTGYFIAGYPNETDVELRQTIDFARSLELDTYSLNVFAPYPGSQLHEAMQGNWEHLINDNPWALFGQSRIQEVNPNISDALLEEYWSLSN